MKTKAAAVNVCLEEEEGAGKVNRSQEEMKRVDFKWLFHVWCLLLFFVFPCFHSWPSHRNIQEKTVGSENVPHHLNFFYIHWEMLHFERPIPRQTKTDPRHFVKQIVKSSNLFSTFSTHRKFNLVHKFILSGVWFWCQTRSFGLSFNCHLFHFQPLFECKSSSSAKRRRLWIEGASGWSISKTKPRQIEPTSPISFGAFRRLPAKWWFIVDNWNHRKKFINWIIKQVNLQIVIPWWMSSLDVSSNVSSASRSNIQMVVNSWPTPDRSPTSTLGSIWVRLNQWIRQKCRPNCWEPTAKRIHRQSRLDWFIDPIWQPDYDAYSSSFFENLRNRFLRKKERNCETYLEMQNKSVHTKHFRQYESIRIWIHFGLLAKWNQQ